MNGRDVPRATYRLQFNGDFTFADAVHVIPYLHALGISHVYASPYLKARKGSSHGYDIVDHNALNPEIGDWNSYETFVASLHAHGMGQILDIVPNHMGIGGDDNAWWLDVLENGQASRYAAYFDIDWHPAKRVLRNKVLLPVLGDPYGVVLESGELELVLDQARGEFSVRYGAHRFPIDPRNYPQILGFRLEVLEQREGAAEAVRRLKDLIERCERLPLRSDPSPRGRERRQREVPVCKRSLSALCSGMPAAHSFLRENVALFNGVAQRPGSFVRLHRLLEAQAYRLAYWRVAADEINYRRFVDVNDLAGMRMEEPEVFDATHRFVLALMAQGKVDGLRIDHPDGLYDPAGYYEALRQRLNATRNEKHPTPYVVVEKILASHEHLPEQWPVDGTTGYDFAYAVNGLFVYPGGRRHLERLYARLLGRRPDFDEVLYESKKLIIRTRLSSELTVLANRLDGIAQSDRRTRDFTLNGLRDALTEVVACFPAYRTYITAGRITEQDRRYVEWAVSRAKRRSPAGDMTVFDFIREVLLLEHSAPGPPGARHRLADFVMRFQQYTAPVVAKAMEDTAFYIHNELVSLNEVGGDPRVFGVSVPAFHRANGERARHWPHGMVATSTHDSKRSEDVRSRINVLSEVAEEWRRHVGRWRRINRAKKRKVDGLRIPTRNDEYLLYQTLIGTWPLGGPDEAERTAFRQRIEGYMLKAAREAKAHTSWINPDAEYEEAIGHFVHRLLDPREDNRFLADFLPFQKRIAQSGLLNGLSQTLLKLTSPGVPDIYQGTELWAFTLVDPDNRRPVDFGARHAMLREMMARDPMAVPEMRALLAHMEDGRAKLYLTWKTLELRRRFPLVFQQGGYLALEAFGDKAEHLCAFARHREDTVVVTVATRWFARPEPFPFEDRLWGQTWVQAPLHGDTGSYRNVLTGETVTAVEQDGRPAFKAADLFRGFPVALLCGKGAESPARDLG